MSIRSSSTSFASCATSSSDEILALEGLSRRIRALFRGGPSSSSESERYDCTFKDLRGSLLKFRVGGGVMAGDMGAVTLVTTVGISNSRVLGKTNSKPMDNIAFPGVSLFSSCVLILFSLHVSSLVYPPWDLWGKNGGEIFLTGKICHTCQTCQTSRTRGLFWYKPFSLLCAMAPGDQSANSSTLLSQLAMQQNVTETKPTNFVSFPPHTEIATPWTKNCSFPGPTI